MMTKKKKPFLSVIVPAYNEATNFADGKLDQAYQTLQTLGLEYEMLLADDGSTDDTLDLLNQFAKDKPEVKVLSLPHRGKGSTVKAGMLEARGENRLFTDFDQSTPLQEVEKLLTFRNKGYDVVIGSREVQGARRDDEPWYRHLMGRVFNYTVRLLTVRGIMDTQCGFKIFSAKAAEKLFTSLKVSVSDKQMVKPFFSAFDVELLFLANAWGYRIAEVPVAWKHVETNRLNVWGNSILMLLQVIRIRLTAMLGGY